MADLSTMKPILSTLAFTNALGFIFTIAGIVEFTFLSPTMFLVAEGILLGAIALSNTPIAKGVAVASFALFMFAYFSTLEIPEPYGNILFVLLFLPNMIAIGLSMLEFGKG